MRPARHNDRTDLELWTAWTSGGDLGARDALLVRCNPVVASVATKIAAGLPSHVDGEDLASVAMLIIITRIDGYDPASGVPFAAYVALCARWAVLDHLRRLDPLTRRERARQRLDGGEQAATVSVDALLNLCDPAAGPDETFDAAHGTLLRDSVRRLPANERFIIGRYYFAGATGAEIGAELGISEGRVSQLHRRALTRLAQHFAEAA